MSTVAPVGATGADAPVDVNAATGGVTPNAQTLEPASSVVQPSDQAPVSGAPDDTQAPAGETAEQLSDPRLAKLTPEQRQEFTRVLTEMRQKDSQKVQEQLGQAQWALELNRLLSSSSPQERAYGLKLLDSARTFAQPQQPAEPDLQNMEERKLEHTARYFSTYRGRVDGRTRGG